MALPQAGLCQCPWPLLPLKAVPMSRTWPNTEAMVVPKGKDVTKVTGIGVVCTATLSHGDIWPKLWHEPPCGALLESQDHAAGGPMLI